MKLSHLRVVIIGEATYFAFLIVLLLLLASLFGVVEANEIHKNGFGGITPFNPTGLTIFNDDIKRSVDYSSESLFLAAEFSILESNGDVKDFSLFDVDLSLTGSPPFIASEFRTSLETDGSTQYASAINSATDIAEGENVTIVWWGQTREMGTQFITGKGVAGALENYFYGIYLEGTQNNLSARISRTGTSSDSLVSSFSLNANQTYALGASFEFIGVNVANVTLWADGNWITNGTMTESLFDVATTTYFVGRGFTTATTEWCNCTHDELLVFKENVDNTTMKLLTTKQHDIVIRSGSGTTTQGFGGLFLSLPWLIVFGLLGWLFFVIFMSWKKAFD